METFWANVCEHYDISTSQLENINTREYRMLMHGDEVPVENVFKGEMFQLNSYTRQKGFVELLELNDFSNICMTICTFSYFCLKALR